MKYTFFLILIFFGCSLSAQQLTYKPINPAFGGETFNYQWMLSSASAQNGFTAPGKQQNEKSDLDRFGETLNSQILSQISRRLLQQQIDGIGALTEPGTFSFGSLEIEVFESNEGLIINILDTSNGEQTQVIVPN
ncbi:curli production assembly/transport component CsgF [Mesonia ostreae]|uniref:Curli production assembly/transport component CsgF n=1 Tax=Mesonia ostreae TaxID=861110 RepID=A0ABU2KEQ9_9FLAO|nr:curli assembly protein CsgF [Mesonia ostreae]MDT0293153.1 curli assembly protein CsgF [Mesonia ostreae]